MPNRLLNQNGIGILWPRIVSPVGFVNEGECVPLLFSSWKMVRIVQQPRESKMRHTDSCVLTEYGPLIGEIQARLHPYLCKVWQGINSRDKVTQSSFLLRMAYHTFQHSNLCCTATEALIHELCSHHLLSSLSPGGKLVSSSSTPAT